MEDVRLYPNGTDCFVAYNSENVFLAGNAVGDFQGQTMQGNYSGYLMKLSRTNGRRLSELSISETEANKLPTAVVTTPGLRSISVGPADQPMSLDVHVVLFCVSVLFGGFLLFRRMKVESNEPAV